MFSKDIVTGMILSASGAWVAWQAQSFPTLGGMKFGPGLFPTIAGTGLAICGLLVLFTGIGEDQAHSRGWGRKRPERYGSYTATFKKGLDQFHRTHFGCDPFCRFPRYTWVPFGGVPFDGLPFASLRCQLVEVSAVGCWRDGACSFPFLFIPACPASVGIAGTDCVVRPSC